MNKVKAKKSKLYRWIVGIVFSLGVIIIGIYPFESQDLNIKIITDQRDMSIKLSHVELSQNENVHFDFSQIKKLKIKEIRIYRRFKSICLQKLYQDNLTNYLQSSESSSFEWTAEGVLFIDNNNVHLVMNDAGSKLFKSLSA